MIRLLKRFAREREGQDVIEYTLLLAFMTFSSVALFIDNGQSISAIWNGADSTLSTAQSSASGQSGRTPHGDHHDDHHD